MTKRVLSLLVGVAIAALTILVPAGAQSQSQTLSATLTGGQEVPGPGDSNATGTATVTLKPGQRLVCYSLSWSNIGNGEDTVTDAHIHKAPVGESGPIVVTLFAGESFDETDSVSRCVTASSRQIAAIIAKPRAYYVNVHSLDFPAGAIRGQLHR
jgi:CHRD domain